MRKLGSRKNGFSSLLLLPTPALESKVVSLHVGGVELLHTGDVKNGVYMAFSISTNPSEVRLCGQLVPLSTLGLTSKSPVNCIKAVLHRTALCRGAEGGNTIWQRDTEVYSGSVSKKCQQVLALNAQVCHACKIHAQYVKGKENCARSPPETTPTVPNGASAARSTQ